MRVLIAAVCVGTAFALAAAPAQGQLVGISAKTKAKKITADLVPAYYPAGSGPGTGDDENDSPAILGTPVQRGKCTFDSGKVTLQAGKDTKVQLKNVKCSGAPFSGSLCGHTKVLNTIMGLEADKKGTVTETTCIGSAEAGDTANTIQFVTGNIGTLSCSNGKCKGTLPPIATDPCPDVDKVSEVRRIEIFDGGAVGTVDILGNTIGACCGPNQTAAGPISVAISPACTGSTQDVMAEMGYINQGVAKK